jgi:IclR family acetate operon transcriptional repressor
MGWERAMTLIEERPRGRQRNAGTTADPVGGVQSLTRALSILDALAESEEGLTLTVLARRVALPPSTAHRLLTTLQRQRFVRFEPSSMSWQIGVQAFVVGNAFIRSRDVVAVARPYMQRMMEESGETANLYVLSGGEAICMAQVQCRQMIRAISRPGGRVGLNFSAAGKAMLAHLPRQEVADVAARLGLPRATRNTIVSFRKLQAELTKTRSRGFAIDDEECALGLRCVAAPILDDRGVAHAAVSLAAPTDRMPHERLAVLGGMVGAAARSVSVELGGVARKPG